MKIRNYSFLALCFAGQLYAMPPKKGKKGGSARQVVRQENPFGEGVHVDDRAGLLTSMFYPGLPQDSLERGLKVSIFEYIAEGMGDLSFKSNDPIETKCNVLSEIVDHVSKLKIDEYDEDTLNAKSLFLKYYEKELQEAKAGLARKQEKEAEEAARLEEKQRKEAARKEKEAAREQEKAAKALSARQAQEEQDRLEEEKRQVEREEREERARARAEAAAEERGKKQARRGKAQALAQAAREKLKGEHSVEKPWLLELGQAIIDGNLIAFERLLTTENYHYCAEGCSGCAGHFLCDIILKKRWAFLPHFLKILGENSAVISGEKTVRDLVYDLKDKEKGTDFWFAIFSLIHATIFEDLSVLNVFFEEPFTREVDFDFLFEVFESYRGSTHPLIDPCRRSFSINMLSSAIRVTGFIRYLIANNKITQDNAIRILGTLQADTRLSNKGALIRAVKEALENDHNGVSARAAQE